MSPLNLHDFIPILNLFFKSYAMLDYLDSPCSADRLKIRIWISSRWMLLSAIAGPINPIISNNGQFLYVLNGRTHNISGFAIQADGTLVPLGTFEGLPAGSVGIASW